MHEQALDSNQTFANSVIQWLESCHQGKFSQGTIHDIKAHLANKG